MSAEKPRLMLLDIYSLFHRAYYAIPSFTTADGQPTGAVYGTASMLIKLLASEKPEYVAVAFDRPGPTFRHELFKEYKGTRPPMPDDLKSQMPILKELIECMDLAIYDAEGFEADDIIGTLSQQAEELGIKAVILTGDKDALQLISPDTEAMIIKKGISMVVRYDEKTVENELGIKPDKVVDLKALAGDSSDNIPGIPGIGPKTATKLLQEYGNLEGLLSEADKIEGKLGERIRAYKEDALLSKTLATINREVPITLNLGSCKFTNLATQRLRELFLKLQFTTLLEELDKKFGVNLFSEVPEEDQVQVKVLVSNDVAQWHRLLSSYSKRVFITALTSETSAISSRYGALSICRYLEVDMVEVGVLTLWEGDETLIDSKALKLLFEIENINWVTENLKAVLNSLLKIGVHLNPNNIDDLSIASYLLNPGVGEHTPSNIILNYLGQTASFPKKFFGTDVTSWEEVGKEVGKVQEKLLRAEPILMRRLKEEDLYSIYRELELPLAGVLAQMENRGIALDKDVLIQLSQKLKESISNYTSSIYELAGKEFNINSPKQLAEVLFSDLGLPILKKTKTGPSTDAEVLDELASNHEIVTKILDYREAVKLKNTYVDALPLLINPQTKRVHTTFCQTVTATGRLSSINPNLQNIPIRTDLGRQVRRAFVSSDPEYVLISADYSQIELRILAHISEDENLISAFLAGKDIHRATASEIFEVEEDMVDDQMRSSAKAINFGIVYGMSSFGLARDTGLSRGKAQEYIDAYFQKYPKVKRYMEDSVKMARERGYTLTLMGRKRWIPDLRSRNYPRRSAAERTAINSPIQGSAADIMKKAMISVDNALKNRPELDGSLILQIHDELICEVRAEQQDQIASLIKKQMEEVFPLKVPLLAEVKIGMNWLEAKEWKHA